MKTQLHEIQHPALQAALERFEGGFGEPFDPAEPAFFFPFLIILEEEVHAQVTRSLVKSFREATARVEAQTARMLAEKRS